MPPSEAFLTAIAFALVKKLFATVVGMTSLEVIYGAFAAAPLFLVWIYVMWMLVLSGAILVRVMSTFSDGADGQNYPDLVAALLVLWAFHQRWQQGETLTDRQAAEVGVDGRQWANIRQALLQQQIIAATNSGDYVLSKDLSRVRLRTLAEMVGVESQLPGESRFLQSLPWFPSVAARMLAIDQKTELEYDVCLTDVFDTKPQTLELPEEDALISDDGVFPIHQAKQGSTGNEPQ